MEQIQSTNQKQTKKTLVFISLIIAMFMAAIEGTIVATAMPKIVGELGDFSLYSWVFSSYLLMQAVTTLIFGKLADLFGRKPVFISGISIFLIGSFLCGLSTSMTMLIIFRFIQGIGAGAVQPISTTIVGDMYTVEERAKVQGYMSSVWGISAIAGPLLGGLIVQYIHWSWIFWINIPLGILGMIGVGFFLHENIKKEKHSIDYVGTALFFIAVSSLMILLIEAGSTWSWLSLQTLALGSLFIVCFSIFLYYENKVQSPMMPLGLWKYRLISMANLATLTSGAIIIGLSSFLPTYVQGVMGYSAIVAGFTLTAMSIGWPVASTLAGRVLLFRIGVWKTAILGGAALVFGSLFFITLQVVQSPYWAGVGSFFIGVGMGLTGTTFIVSIQKSVDWNMRGVVTATNSFMRTFGGALGAALFGGILNGQLKRFFSERQADLPEEISHNTANLLLDEGERSKLSDATIQLLEQGFSYSLHIVYWGIVVFAIASLILIIFLPKRIKLK